MLATGRGLCFEHVSRMGSVLTAVQRTRQCSTIITERIYIYSLNSTVFYQNIYDSMMNAIIMINIVILISKITVLTI